jgi:hypothetical protein
MGKVNVLFNSPIEIGLRLLFIFHATNKALDLQRLAYYNYLLVHSADVPDAPQSLHPNLPNRSCEIVINRSLVQKGLKVLLAKQLIDVKYTKKGVYYKANRLTSILAINFTTEYSNMLKNIGSWVVKSFDTMSDNKIEQYFNSNLGKWGSEFSREFQIEDAQ